MKNKLIIAFLLGSTQFFAQIPTKNEFIFSAVKGTESKVDSLSFVGMNDKVVPSISGEGKDFFKIITQHKIGKKETILIAFSPANDFIGISQATLLLTNSAGKTVSSIALRGLSLKGIEGENEASLESIVKILGYPINVGWSTLANHSKPILQGDEIATGTFQKAGEGKVEMIAVARFSPNFELPFGYYTNSPQGLQQHQVGILAKTKKTLEHSTLFPVLSFGGTTFDPENTTFGFYSIGPNHTAYSSDVWNQLYYAENVAHATRIYPVKNQANTYLVCFEEAKNGDYNDYVFLVKNIKPVQESFANLFNGKDLTGWNSFLQGKGVNKDNEQNFKVENAILHVRGKELGYIRTQKNFDNYHFKVDFKWGEVRWTPRDKEKRDAGICYNIPDKEPDSIWPKSAECQIQEGDVGDFWLIDYATIVVDGKQNEPSAHTRMTKKQDAEKPTGEWNTVEVISFNGRCVHIVNGVVVNIGDNASAKNGSILLQSEYAEVYYRNAEIRELR
jgi:hypothetical protein